MYAWNYVLLLMSHPERAWMLSITDDYWWNYVLSLMSHPERAWNALDYWYYWWNYVLSLMYHPERAWNALDFIGPRAVSTLWMGIERCWQIWVLVLLLRCSAKCNQKNSYIGVSCPFHDLWIINCLWCFCCVPDKQGVTFCIIIYRITFNVPLVTNAYIILYSNWSNDFCR